MPEKKPATISEYLSSLPPERKKAISAVRKVVKASVPKGIKETFNWGMIAYEVPLRDYPDTYNGKPLLYAAIASQKSHMAVYLMCLYADKKLEKTFRAHFAESGKKLDMGKSCVRFKKLEALDLKAIANAVSSMSRDEFIAIHEKTHKK